jgi:hypothetical protein
MKTITILLVIIATTIGCTRAQVLITVPPEWKITLHLVDEAGQPVREAQTTVGYIKPGTSSDIERITGSNDDNGSFTASGRSWARLYFSAEKTNYYITLQHYDIGTSAKTRYEPWNPTITLVLKKIGEPIPMYAKHVEGGPPAFNKSVGYDLMTGDWVGPYGKGIKTDIIFTGELNQKAKNDFDYKLTISFPNVRDGIQSFSVSDKSMEGSALRSPRKAPQDGYESRLVRTMSRHPGRGTKEDINELNRNYFFRVRTVVDDKGNIVSTHYGKIYGDFMEFKYYLNPTPNDRNVEFDPSRNLLKNLKSDEGVSAP